MNLIGIAGTNGSGKDSVGGFLAEKHGWLFISVTEILRSDLKKQGLPIERTHLRELSAEWRRQYGLGVLVVKAYQMYKADKTKYKGLAIASLRNPGEADEVHKLGGQVIWVDADPRVRYQRINSRQRGSEDQKTFEQFLKEEQDEMSHADGDHHTLSLAGVKAKADIFIENNSNKEAFLAEVEKDLSLKP
jgi:dephospho-CoA kinase